MFFFFQAEDGIRDLVRSRGLGDVYKRQMYNQAMAEVFLDSLLRYQFDPESDVPIFVVGYSAVSYTHLTLPTSDLV